MSDIDRDIDRFHTELCRRLPSNNPITPVRLHNLRVLVRHAAQQAGFGPVAREHECLFLGDERDAPERGP